MHAGNQNIEPDYSQCQPDIGVAPATKQPDTKAKQHASYDTEVETGDSQQVDSTAFD